MSVPYFGLESFPRVSFRDLQDRLISFVVMKIRNGEFTERRLARVLGVSQPQLHNVLKGARPLKPEFADCLFKHFDIGVVDLLSRAELSARIEELAAEQVQFWLGTLPAGELAAPRKSPGKGETASRPCLRRLAS
jgi:transcriptional regulator with XRE-family HTH domain